MSLTLDKKPTIGEAFSQTLSTLWSGHADQFHEAGCAFCEAAANKGVAQNFLYATVGCIEFVKKHPTLKRIMVDVLPGAILSYYFPLKASVIASVGLIES